MSDTTVPDTTVPVPEPVPAEPPRVPGFYLDDGFRASDIVKQLEKCLECVDTVYGYAYELDMVSVDVDTGIDTLRRTIESDLAVYRKMVAEQAPKVVPVPRDEPNRFPIAPAKRHAPPKRPEDALRTADVSVAVLDYLAGYNEPVRTIHIAREMFGPQSTRKDINPTLYKLEKMGQISKTANENGGDPKWSLST